MGMCRYRIDLNRTETFVLGSHVHTRICGWAAYEFSIVVLHEAWSESTLPPSETPHNRITKITAGASNTALGTRHDKQNQILPSSPLVPHGAPMVEPLVPISTLGGSSATAGRTGSGSTAIRSKVVPHVLPEAVDDLGCGLERQSLGAKPWELVLGEPCVLRLRPDIGPIRLLHKLFL